VFVKVCGTTSEEDALLAVAMGADAIGFIFAPSTRQVSVSLVTDVVKRLPPEILTIGVFRDEAPQRVVDIVNATGLRGAQLHGHESLEATRFVRDQVRVVIKAFPGGDPELAHAASYAADIVMLDSASPGSGRVFDWSLAEGAPSGLRLMLAGGLNPGNVAQAIAKVRPWGVDVATGVESAPGVKDPVALRAFINAARASAPAEYESRAEPPFDWMVDE
jgi:phosphoribosylanthranilate isomerase